MRDAFARTSEGLQPFQNRHSNEDCISPHRHSGEGRNRFCTSAPGISASERRAFTLLRRARYFSFACPKEKYPRENDTPLADDIQPISETSHRYEGHMA